LYETRFSITIDRPVEEVFAVLSNPEITPTWSSLAVEETVTSTGPIGVGTTYRAVGVVFGRRVVNENEVTEFEPNRMWTVRVLTGPMRTGASMAFEPVERGTHITMRITMEPAGLLRLAAPLLVRLGRRQFQRDLEHLKRLMETGALVAPEPERPTEAVL
jgi:uncharacterized membrane protein